MKKNTRTFGFASFRGFLMYAFIAVPSLAFAQTNVESLESAADFIINFINNTLVPLIFALALIVFIWGLFTAFILGGSDPEKQKEGRSLMLWGIIAFFVMVSVWGLVNILVGTFNLDQTVDLPEIQER